MKSELLNANKRFCDELARQIPQKLKKHTDKWWNSVKVDISPLYTVREFKSLPLQMQKQFDIQFNRLEVNLYYNQKIDGQETIAYGNYFPIAKNLILFYNINSNDELLLKSLDEVINHIAYNLKE